MRDGRRIVVGLVLYLIENTKHIFNRLTGDTCLSRPSPIFGRRLTVRLLNTGHHL